MTQAIDITAEQRRTILALLNRHLPGTTVWAYGSRVKWTSRPESDLDLVAFARPEQSARVAELREAFEESNLPFRVDLFVWDEVSEGFRTRIEAEHVVLVEDNPDRKYNMKNRWRRCRIEDVAEKVAMGPFGSSIKVDTFTLSGVPIISGQHLHGSRVDDKPGFNFISEEHAQRLRGANVRRGDIIFTHAGNIGHVASIPENSQYDRYVVSQRQFYMRPKLSEAIPEFIVAYFKTPEGQHELLANASQVGVPSIARPVTYLRSIEVPIPPIQEQREIACILGALDDKIELNRRMNETLEAMARALFKSWFVDFDPVRAKMEGRDTGLPKPIADLFPDQMIESELGLVPDGWEVFPLSKVIEINPTRALRKGEVAPYLDMANMPTKGHVPHAVVHRQFGSGMRFINGDTLVARITPCLENGKTAYVDFLQHGETGWGSTEYIVMRPMPPLPNEFAYYLARSARFREFAIQNMTGTSGRQRAPAAALSKFPLTAPPTSVAECFGRFVRPLMIRASESEQESRALAALRDALLPKLISGELHVEDGMIAS